MVLKTKIQKRRNSTYHQNTNWEPHLGFDIREQHLDHA